MRWLAFLPWLFFAPALPVVARTIYPWKTNITTTVFWIGKDAEDEKRLGAEQNPFYVALPFNDLRYSAEAAHWVPATWRKPPSYAKGELRSSCLGRWVEIEDDAGHVAYAQWLDFGPEFDDDPAYVFGHKRPLARAGLDVSPAVAQRLAIDRSKSLSWRFVDDSQVPEGPWMDRLGGQLLIASPGH